MIPEVSGPVLKLILIFDFALSKTKNSTHFRSCRIGSGKKENRRMKHHPTVFDTSERYLFPPASCKVLSTSSKAKLPGF